MRAFLVLALRLALLAGAAGPVTAQSGGWEPLGGGIAREVRALVLADDGTLYAGQVGPAGVWTWNGTMWTRIGADTDGSAYAIALAPDAPMPGVGRSRRRTP